MIIVQPVPVTSAMVTASNVTITETLWTAGTYTLGQERYVGTRLYKVLVASTTDNPTVGVTLTPPSWQDIGAINRFKMFDQVVNTQTTRTGLIDVSILPGTIINALAMFDLDGVSTTITMTDPVEGVVFNETKSLQDNTIIIDWYSYFFESITTRSDVVFLGLPAYGSATIRIQVDAGASTAAIGEVVIGKQRNLGVTNFGTSVSILDYSRKETDEFGNTVVETRPFSKRADYDVTVETGAIAAVQKALASIRTTPTVFIGDEDRAETIVYGFYRGFNIVISTPSISDCSIEVEGLI
jgi:hypothetical protein